MENKPLVKSKLGIYHSVCKRHFLAYTSAIFTPHTFGYELKNEPCLNKKLPVFD